MSYLPHKRLGNIILSEYVIWGIPPGETESTLLVASHKNEVITSKDLAEALKQSTMPVSRKIPQTESFVALIIFISSLVNSRSNSFLYVMFISLTVSNFKCIHII